MQKSISEFLGFQEEEIIAAFLEEALAVGMIDRSAFAKTLRITRIPREQELIIAK
jgi:hypothetical protein